MKNEIRNWTLVTLIILCIVGIVPSTQASEFPNRGITLIVPWPPGSTDGIIAQKIANIMIEKQICPPGMQVVFKPGGTGTVGFAEVLRSNPDGYTLLYSSNGPFVLQPLVKDLPFTSKSLTPVIQTAKYDWVLGVQGDAPWKTVPEFIEYAKQHPGEMTIGSPGEYTWGHIALLDIQKATGLKFRHVPFAGSAPAVVALVGGHVNAILVIAGDLKAQVAAGKARYLAAVEPQRNPYYPDVPSLKEFNLPVYGTYLTQNVIAPKDTPENIIATLHGMFKKAIETEEFKSLVKDVGGFYNYVGYKELPGEIDKEVKRISVLLEGLGKEVKSN
jgi:tripartite-type tricarboxylate transporter receptor subunit TctC